VTSRARVLDWKRKSRSFPFTVFDLKKMKEGAGHHPWLMSVILATWEAEIRTTVASQPGQIVHDTPHLQNNQSKMDWRCGSSSRVPDLQS
jgi:hypothetical protein